MPGTFRQRAGWVVLALAAIALVLAAWAWLTGGFRVYVVGIPLSARGEHRAAAVAGALGALAVLLLDRDLRRTRAVVARGIADGLRFSGWIARRSPRLLTALAVLAAATVLYLGLQLGVRSAGGSDPAGYVGQAMLWRSGTLRIANEIARDAPWPDADATLTPLAYTPSTDHTQVPVVAPGLPLLMALASLVAGGCGPFLVGPLCAALLVLSTFALGIRVSNHAVGAMAAVTIAASPTMLFMSMSAMSDVPAAAFWTLSLALALRPGSWAALPAGAAAGVAMTIRPNLAPLALYPLLIASWPSGAGTGIASVRRASAFAAACAPAVVFVAWLFNDLYGSPLTSGYGDASGLFARRHFLSNVARYPAWLWDTQGPIPFLVLLAPLLAWRNRGHARAAVWLLLAFAATTMTSYVFYEPFDAWWFLRFLLPAFAPVFVLAFAVIWMAIARFRPFVRRLVAVLAAAAAVYHGAGRTREFGLAHLAEGEQKYADAARFADAHLPANAVVLSMQHSGSIRLYSGRPVLRYDLLDREWLDAALEHVQRHGYAPYLLLEDWEVEIYRERFATQAGAGLVAATPLAATPGGHVLVFRGVPARTPPPPLTIPRASGCAPTRVDLSRRD